MDLRFTPAMMVMLAVASPAGAQSGGASQRVLDGFAACRALPGDAARLACFDKAAGALETAVKAKEVQIVDRGDMRRAKRSLFGFALPKLDLFGTDRDDDPDAFTEINSTVAYTRTLANSRVEIGLADDDAVWQTTDPLNWPPKKGAKIRIRKGSLGNYFIAADGGVRTRAMRIR